MKNTPRQPRRDANADAVTELFERETRRAAGQYTHIEPEAGDLGESEGVKTRHFPEKAGDEDSTTIHEVYEGPSYEELVPSAAYHVTMSNIGHSVVLSLVDDPENTHWIQSNVARSLAEYE